MKRIIALLVAILLIIPSALAAPQVTTADSIDLTKFTDKELADLASAILAEQQARIGQSGDYIVSGNLGEYFVGLKKTEVKGDKLYLYFDYSHNREEADCYALSLNVEGYQNGIGCEIAYTFDETNQMTQIKKGATIEVIEILKIKDSAPVEIEISELINFFSNEKLTATIPVK